jgi:hypothetical protein
VAKTQREVLKLDIAGLHMPDSLASVLDVLFGKSVINNLIVIRDDALLH